MFTVQRALRSPALMKPSAVWAKRGIQTKILEDFDDAVEDIEDGSSV